MGSSPRPGRCDVPLALCRPEEPFSTPLELDRAHCDGYGSFDIAPRMPDKAGSSTALRNEANPEHYHGEAFSPLAPSRSHAHRC
jgi:hypothetical protein